MSLRLLTVAGLILLAGCAGLPQPGRFSADGLEQWQAQVFNKATDYRIVQDGERKVLQAFSRQSASALYRRLEVDLRQTPVLNWQWKVQHTLGELDEQEKVGDDYPARIYVLLSPLPLRLSPRALCYVWSSNTPAGGHWPSPYSRDIVIVNLRSGDTQAGQWLAEKRNIREDIKRYFGMDLSYAEGIALMTDTDNSQSEVTSYYGDIYFSAE